MRIAGKTIGPDEPPYIIAELGVNHDGDLGRALELVDAAAAGGADAVKVQHFEPGTLLSRDARLAEYQSGAGETDPRQMLGRLRLGPAQLAQVAARAHKRGLAAIATVFSVELVREADRLGFDAFKTASPDVINRPLLERLAATGAPLIVSTGAATLDEVDRAAGWLDDAHDRLALLQCVSSYPTPWEEAGFGGVRALDERFERFAVPVGYSDHTVGTHAAAHAVAMGACLLEKHITHDTEAAGPDHAASLHARDLPEYRAAAEAGLRLRGIAGMMREGDGTASIAEIAGHFGMPPEALAEIAEAGWLAGAYPPEKRVLDCERDCRLTSRQSLVATRDLPAGHTLAAGDLTIKRPGTGLEPHDLDRVIGRRLVGPVEADRVLFAADVGLEPLRDAG